MEKNEKIIIGYDTERPSDPVGRLNAYMSAFKKQTESEPSAKDHKED